MKATMKIQRKKLLKSKPVQTWYQHLTTSDVNTEEVYTEETGALIAMRIRHFNNKLAGMTYDQTASFLQTYSLNKG